MNLHAQNNDALRTAVKVMGQRLQEIVGEGPYEVFLAFGHMGTNCRLRVGKRNEEPIVWMEGDDYPAMIRALARQLCLHDRASFGTWMWATEEPDGQGFDEVRVDTDKRDLKCLNCEQIFTHREPGQQDSGSNWAQPEGGLDATMLHMYPAKCPHCGQVEAPTPSGVPTS